MTQHDTPAQEAPEQFRERIGRLAFQTMLDHAVVDPDQPQEALPRYEDEPDIAAGMDAIGEAVYTQALRDVHRHFAAREITSGLSAMVDGHVLIEIEAIAAKIGIDLTTDPALSGATDSSAIGERPWGEP